MMKPQLAGSFLLVALLNVPTAEAVAQPLRPSPRPDRAAAVRPLISRTLLPSLRPARTANAAKTRRAAAVVGAYRIVAVGDTMIGSDFPSPILNPVLTRDVRPSKILGPRLARILEDGPNKLVFANIEGTIHALQGPSKRCGNPRLCFVFRMPPYYARILRRVGFTLGSMANNHGGDFLDGGRLATYRALTRAGINAAGVDRAGMRTAVVRLADGTRVGFTAFGHNPGILSITDIPRAKRILRDLSRRSDIVLVSFHGGAEGAGATRVPKRTEAFVGENRGDVYRFARAVVDAGADVVIGHGPHVPRAVEVYKRRFIAYSLGNFWTYGRFNLRGLAGVAPVADVTVNRRGQVVAVRLHPTRQVGRGVPRYDPTGSAIRAVAKLTKLDFPNSKLMFHKDGRVTGPGIGR